VAGKVVAQAAAVVVHRRVVLQVAALVAAHLPVVAHRVVCQRLPKVEALQQAAAQQAPVALLEFCHVAPAVQVFANPFPGATPTLS
jgi:hypothetical protein